MGLRRLLLAALLAAGVVSAGGTAAAPAAASWPPAHPSPPIRLIVDTDFGQWWDDVAALGMVHAAADAGRVHLLGIMSDVDNPWDAAGLDALDTWYGRPDIPIGVPTGAISVEQNYSQLLAQSYPHAGQPSDAVGLYRRLLQAQPDHSVTILSIGALTNLAQLDRTDAALVARKVVSDWPTRTVYDGFEIGAGVFVGNHVCATHPADSPVRAVFDLLYGCGTNQTDGTWDPTAMYYALYGGDDVYELAGAGGHNTVTPDGLNTWVAGGHHQRYLLLTDTARLTNAIDALIDSPRRPD